MTAGPGPVREGTWQQGATEANAETAFADFATRWPGKARDCLLASASLPLKWGCFCKENLASCETNATASRDRGGAYGRNMGCEDIKNVALCGSIIFTV